MSKVTLRDLLPRLREPKGDGKGGWWAFCPCHPDGTKTGPGHPRRSLHITEKNGRVLLHCFAGCRYRDIMAALGLSRPASNNQEPEAVYRYVDENGNLLFEVCRFPGKNFRQRRPDGAGGWTWNLKDTRRVLYRLPEVLTAVREGRTIFLTEGEKDADNLAALGLAATTCPGGAGKWRPEYSEALRGADVVILPDADEPGRRHAEQVARALHGVAARVRVVQLPALPEKGDVSDWLAAGGTKERLLELAEAAPEWQPAVDTTKAPARIPVQKEDHRSQADILIEIAQDAELFHDDEREPFATIEIAGHREIWPVRSRFFKRWLVGQFFEQEEKAPNADALNQALNVIEALAVFRGECHPLHLRVAEHDGAFWYDLADSAWRAVKITPDGWEVVDRPPILFRRYQNTAAQVVPERGGDLRHLLLLTNVRNSDDQILLLVYTVTMLVPGIPKPVLDVFGEKGSGKTTLMRMVRMLIDPAVEPLLVLRGDERELAIQLAHNYAPFFDNMSGLSMEQSDMLCRAATGGGFTTRALYTDDEEKIFRFKRAVGVNGIHLLTGGTDLQDRFLTIELERIDRGDRAEERQILEEFEQMRPRLFGAMLDALSKAMRIKSQLEINELPRMADFASWGAAVAEALDIGAKRFLAAYWRNIGQVNERILQSHPVAAAVVALLNETPEWQGTPAQLLETLEQVAEREKINVRGKTWPKSANALSRRLKEIASNLADAGIELETGKDTAGVRGRFIRLLKGCENIVATVATVEVQENQRFPCDDICDGIGAPASISAGSVATETQ